MNVRIIICYFDMKDILEGIYASVCSDLKKSCLDNAEISQSVDKVCRCVGCKAPIRFLISGLLAKIKNIDVDLRKPHSTMGEHSFAGRSIDEVLFSHLCISITYLVIRQRLI